MCLADEPGVAHSAQQLRAHVPDLEYVRISPHLRRAVAFVHVALTGSATRAYFHSAALQARLRERLQREPFDLIYVSSSSMAPYAMDTSLPVVMDFVDLDSDKWLQYADRCSWAVSWIYRREGRRLRRLEQAIARRATYCLVATEAEHALLRAVAPWARSAVVPNGVDLDTFAPPACPPREPIIVFSGAMDYFPNVDAVTFFVHSILPHVRTRVPEAQFIIVGKDPTLAVRRLSRQPGVQVTGYVPDVRPFLHRARLAVAPLRLARGIQNKILEAMAAGLPVVATSKAHQGLNAAPGRDLLVADQPEEFADAVVRLLQDSAYASEMGRAARTFVASHHAWASVLSILDAILRQATEGAPALAEVAG
jgi:sugar transferase (PEP-CTERM/EpsH1 system associated)